jgi:hypothetical protein
MWGDVCGGARYDQRVLIYVLLGRDVLLGRMMIAECCFGLLMACLLMMFTCEHKEMVCSRLDTCVVCRHYFCACYVLDFSFFLLI